MAIRYAVATGNWSDTATWDGGTLPTSADDVYANAFTVTIDQDVTVLSLRNTANTTPAVTVGGGFVLNDSFTATCSGGSGLVVGTANLLTYSGSSSATLITNGLTVATTVVQHYVHSGTGHLTFTSTSSAMTGPNNAGQNAFVFSGAGQLTLNMNLASSTGSSNSAALLVSGGGTVNINGNIAHSYTTNNENYVVNVTTTEGATINVVGNLSAAGGGNSAFFSAAIRTSVACTVNVTGTLQAATGFAYCIRSTSTLTAVISGSLNTNGISATGPAAITVNGAVVPGTTGSTGTAAAIAVSGSTASVTINNSLTSSTRDCIISSAAASTITVTGESLSGTGAASCVNIAGGLATINITADVTTGTTGAIINLGATNSTLNMTGSFTTPTQNNIVTGTGNPIITMTGNLAASAQAFPAINVSGNTASVDVVGNVTAFKYLTTNGHAVQLAGTGSTAIIRGNLTSTEDGWQAVYARILKIGAAGTQQTMTLVSPTNTTRALYTVEFIENYPAESNVKTAISYGPGNIYTGTWQGVNPPAELAAAVWDYAISSATAEGSMGARLKNAATVATTGAQIAGFGE
jgi:hypothetical protein